MAAGGANESTSVIVLTAEPRTPVGLTHRLKVTLGPSGWIATAFHDPHLAFAELCLRERAQASRAAWGLQRVEKIAMVLVDPARWPASADLVAAIKRYTPTAVVWAYRDGQLQSLAAGRTAEASAADHAMTVMDIDDETELLPHAPAVNAPSRQPAPSPPKPPALRLAGMDEQSEQPPNETDSLTPAATDTAQQGSDSGTLRAARSASTSTARVSREEIELLLRRESGDDASDAAKGTSGASA